MKEDYPGQFSGIHNQNYINSVTQRCLDEEGARTERMCSAAPFFQRGEWQRTLEDIRAL